MARLTSTSLPGAARRSCFWGRRTGGRRWCGRGGWIARACDARCWRRWRGAPNCLPPGAAFMVEGPQKGRAAMAREWPKGEMNQEIDRALARGRRRALSEPRAARARYDRRTGRVVVDLSNGCSFVFPGALAPGPGAGKRRRAGRHRDPGVRAWVALAGARRRFHGAGPADGRVRHARLDDLRAGAPGGTGEVARQSGRGAQQWPQGRSAAAKGGVRDGARAERTLEGKSSGADQLCTQQRPIRLLAGPGLCYEVCL